MNPNNRFSHILPMYQKPDECRGCPLERDGIGYAMAEGTGALRVLALGEALGPNEAKEGLPFRPDAQAGSLLERAFRLCGYSRTQFGIFNVVNCLPPGMELAGAPYELAAAMHCRVHLNKVIEHFKPRCILALGNVAMRSLTGHSGDKQSINHLRGFVLHSPEYPDIPVVASYHPSFIQRGQFNLLPVLARDIKYAVQIARDGFNPKPVSYNLYCRQEEARYLINECEKDPEVIQSIDFETEGNFGTWEDQQLTAALEELYGEPKARKKTKKQRERLGVEQHVTQINISIKERESFVFQFTTDIAPLMSRFMSLPNHKIGHNCFAKNTSILTPNGWKPIWQFKVGDDVTSMNNGGQMTVEKVTGVIKNESRGEWLEVNIDGAHNRGVGKWGSPGIVCTPDHEWFVHASDYAFRKKRAVELQPGDVVALPRIGDYDLLAGTLLGDAHVTDRGQFSVCHTDVAWAQCKADALGASMIGRELTSGYKPGMAYFVNATVPKYWRARHYTNTKQRVWNAPDNLKQLAAWYCDDGCFTKEGRNGRNGNATLSIHKYPLQKERIRDWFVWLFGGDGPGYDVTFHNDYVLYLHINASEKFFEAIAPYVPPAMERKIPSEFRGKYNGWLERKTVQLGRVLSIIPTACDSNEYCLEVSKTHRFFTRGGLVSNCMAFDQRVATFNGLPWVGDSDDTMLMFHALFPDVPGRVGKNDELDGTFANLQYCAGMFGFDQPWKHAVSEQPEWYGACDSDASLRLYNGLRPQMMSLKYSNTGPSIWDGYRKLVARLWPILMGASVRGIPTKREKMLRFLDSVVTRKREVDRHIQTLIPDELLPTKQKMGLKNTPKDTSGFVQRDFVLEAEKQNCCVKVRKKDIARWLNVEGAEVSDKDGKLRAPDPECPKCNGVGFIELPERQETRWVKLLEFNANSHVQLKKYAIHNHHKIPKNKDGKIAMDKWTLDQMGRTTRDPIYEKVKESRQFEKNSSYAIQWMPRDDGRVHPEFSFYPATGQISSFNPNAQNVMSTSKYGQLAIDFRDGIEAPEGYRIVELDYKSFHVQTLGFEANCPQYIRLAKLDVHSYVAGTLLKLPHFEECIEWEDGELLAFLKWHRKNYVCPDGTTFQKVRDERAKIGVLAFGLGQQATSLFVSNRDSFLPDWYLSQRENRVTQYDADHKRADKEGLHSAQLVHDALNDRFPELKYYRDNTPLLAKKNGNKIVSRYGCIRWFWDINHWDGNRKQFVRGEDWEKAIAFPVQNDAHGYLKYGLIRADELGYLEKYGFINTVHDSVVFCCNVELVDECIVSMKRELERSSDVLIMPDGTPLSVECEAKVGRTWGHMEEVTV